MNNVTTSRPRLLLGLYLNYFIHGFGIIILAQNMTALSNSWHTSIKIVSFVISGIGIGRLFAYLLTGALADLLNRKLLIYLGMAAYFIFAVGMVTTKNIAVVYAMAILAGVANSALDAGTYPTLVEVSDGNGYGTVLIKGAMSAGEFVLPLLVAWLADYQLWFGWSFMVMAGLLVVNALNLLPITFAQRIQTSAAADSIAASRSMIGKKVVQTILLLAYGYSSMALMIWFTQWITIFAQRVFHYSNLAAHGLLSLYSIGSIVGVFVLFYLLKIGTNEFILLIGLNLLALLSLVVLIRAGGEVWLANAMSLIFGFSAVSGVMQTGLTVFMKLYPAHRGLVTGAFYFFGSIASFTVPLISGSLSVHSVGTAFSANLLVAGSGFLLMLVLALISHSREVN